MKYTILILLFLISINIFSEEGNWELGPQINYSGYMKPDKYSHGFGLGVNAIYNIDDFLGISMSVDFNKHLSKTGYVSNIYGGIIYNLDVLRVIPVLEIGFSGTILKNNELNDNFLSINLYGGVAVSYLISWKNSISVFFRYQTSINDYDEIFDSYFVVGTRFNFIIESD